MLVQLRIALEVECVPQTQLHVVPPPLRQRMQIARPGRVTQTVRQRARISFAVKSTGCQSFEQIPLLGMRAVRRWPAREVPKHKLAHVLLGDLNVRHEEVQDLLDAWDWREAAYSLGILKTGYLETPSEQWDRSSASNSTVKKTRFVVLTHAQLSWFKRNPGDTEYGDERGAIPLDQVTRVSLTGEKIEVFDQGGLRRWFLCRDGKAKAWRDAIDVARQARCRSPAASSPREAPSALIIRTRQYAKSIVETRAAYGAASLVEPAAPGSESASLSHLAATASRCESFLRRRRIDGVEGDAPSP